MSPSELYTISERKTNGIFYTPDFLSDFLAQKIFHYLKSVKELSLLDPACGNSILLRSLLKIAYFKNLNINRLIGIDKDKYAVKSSWNYFMIKDPNLKINFIETDGLFPYEYSSSKEGWLELKKRNKVTKGFNIIASNPPWGASMKDYDTNLLSNNFSLAKGQFDIYNLFIEVIICNLAKDGIYGLIIPDSIFSQEQSKLRCMLSCNTTIHMIARLGEKIFPEINRACVVIVGSNRKPTINHNVDCMRLSSDYRKQLLMNKLSLEDIEKILVHKIPQKRFSDNENYIFDIDLKDDEKTALVKIENNSFPLKKIVNNTRGAEISKKGIVCQCPICKKWMPYPKSKEPHCLSCNNNLNLDSILIDNIVLNHSGKGNFKLKVGEDLYRYTSHSKSWINTLKEGINYKTTEIYNGTKILVRKTGIGITASIDYDNSFTNQVVYILKLKPEYESSLSLEFVLSILNSRAITYYLIKKFGENEWRTHPYLTQGMLIDLPFPNIDWNSEVNKQKVQFITNIIRDEVITSKEKNISKKNDIYIEKTIADFFKLDKNDYSEIFNTLSASEQLIPIKRLMNCNINEIFETNGI